MDRAMRWKRGGEGEGKGKGKDLYRERFELFRARGTRIFNLAKADLICPHEFALLYTRISTDLAKSRRERETLSPPRENCAHVAFPRTLPKLFWQPFKRPLRYGIAGRIREHPPWDFHYQRQRGAGRGHLVPSLKPDL